MGFPTYGMAGIGIAAAIGFVFALSFLGSNNGAVDDGQLVQSAPADEQQRMAEPLADQKSGEAGDSSLAKDSGEEAFAGPAGESMMMQLDLRPTLVSVVALDSSREQIGEVTPGTEFKAGQPVLIQATFANENDAIAFDNFVYMSARSADSDDSLSYAAGPNEDSASMQGDIAGNSAVVLELYWNPQSVGEYELLIFLTKGGELANAEAIEPAATIPIKVVD
jgi:hypothetical protein